ncbi:DUF4232 domain-containing protein [Kutzneria viridogrisea]|uniref:DUF4232 domain-containing protein n=1 Tax=Kutzneria viridogrisea TaxID=47990 RepID=A0ABR6B8W4_9PSEU|nr:hypothetical protein [Kutzneria viridogrisea]
MKPDTPGAVRACVILASAGLLLAACGTPSTQATPGASVTAPASSTASTPAPSAAQPVTQKRCATSELSLSVGKPIQAKNGSGGYTVPLVYKNISSRTCDLYGVPGVDLLGPADPNGDTYHLPQIDNGAPRNSVDPGDSATADISVLPYSLGSNGSNGSTKWVPTTLKTIPPDQTTALTANWPEGLSVLRQDAATHPGTYVNGILANP